MYRKKNCPKEFPFLLSKFRALKKKASGHSTKSGLIKQRAENENHLSADHIATSPLPPMPPAGDKRAIYPEEQGIENGTSQEYDNRAAKFSSFVGQFTITVETWNVVARINRVTPANKLPCEEEGRREDGPPNLRRGASARSSARFARGGRGGSSFQLGPDSARLDRLERRSLLSCKSRSIAGGSRSTSGLSMSLNRSSGYIRCPFRGLRSAG